MTTNTRIPFMWTRLILAFITLLVGMGLQSGVATAAPTTTIDRWIQDASSTSETVRIKALNALGQSGDRRALQPLLTALRDANPTIHQHAIEALQKLAQTLDKAYSGLVHWINTWLITVGAYTTPPLPVERTQHRYQL